MPEPASTALLPNACRSWRGRTGTSSPARRDAAAISSPAAEQVDEHEITVGAGDAHAFEFVGVECLNHKKIQRHHPLSEGLGPRAVRVVGATHHMQMRPRDIAAQPPRIHQQVHIAAPQPAHLPAPQPGPCHQQHDKPVPRRTAAQSPGRCFPLATPPGLYCAPVAASRTSQCDHR